jgi:hypothetical protein
VKNVLDCECHAIFGRKLACINREGKLEEIGAAKNGEGKRAVAGQ